MDDGHNYFFGTTREYRNEYDRIFRKEVEMPLKKGKSKKVMNKNFHELKHGKQYAKTARKYGKKKAQKQMIAIVLKQAGVSKKRKGGR